MHEMAGYPTWRWEFDFTVGSVLPGLAEGPVLDIGAGFGGFLRRLDKRWTRCATEGSETTRRILRDAEIRCYTDLSEAVREAGGTFAVVTMFQVLEHLSNFENILAGCNALLRPGGVLVVAVPDADSTWAQERLTGFPDMIPNHINKWTPHALEIAMRRAGFNAEPVRHEPGSWRFVTYRALLRVKAKSSRDPSSCGAMAYRLRMRWLRIPILAGLAGMELIRCTGRLHEMYHGRSIVMVAGKSMS
jgi:SAM-dependent methyltransferase